MGSNTHHHVAATTLQPDKALAANRLLRKAGRRLETNCNTQLNWNSVYPRAARGLEGIETMTSLAS